VKMNEWIKPCFDLFVNILNKKGPLVVMNPFLF